MICLPQCYRHCSAARDTTVYCDGAALRVGMHSLALSVNIPGPANVRWNKTSALVLRALVAIASSRGLALSGGSCQRQPRGRAIPIRSATRPARSVRRAVARQLSRDRPVCASVRAYTRAEARVECCRLCCGGLRGFRNETDRRVSQPRQRWPDGVHSSNGRKCGLGLVVNTVFLA
jgi:hypothetical protein